MYRIGGRLRSTGASLCGVILGLAKAVTKFESDVTIVFEDKKINAKSLLNIIGACIKCGSEIELVCEGPDEEAALAHATELIESGLGE